MKKSQYQALHDGVLRRPGLTAAVRLCVRILPGMVYLAYPLMLVWLLIAHRSLLLRALLVPLLGFLTVTVLRARIDAPRPYEALGIPAITPKETKGKSFPSRHAACAGVIAMTALGVMPPLGAVLLLLAVLICVSRVLAGVHFIRDVLAGLALGVAIGFVGMFLF